MLTVELRAAKLPWLGAIAVHYWFVILSADRSDRWEVWQNRIVPSTSANHLHWGHLHSNLMEATRGVGNGPSWRVAQWPEPAAIDFMEILESSPSTYPYTDRYCFWPGPNSNTYVQWVCQQAQRRYGHLPVALSWRGWGKNFPIPASLKKN
ncbi:MAG: hypothetical protein RLZZ435_1361 [Cyanobacteriota bacterium]|jgi:hypothetical protein